MKNQTIVRKSAWLLALCFASALIFSACQSTTEHPTQTNQPQPEHPEHPK